MAATAIPDTAARTLRDLVEVPTLADAQEINPGRCSPGSFGDQNQIAGTAIASKQAFIERSIDRHRRRGRPELDKDLGLADHRKLESISKRSGRIEKQIQAAEKGRCRHLPRWRLRRHPHRFPTYLRLMMDLLVVAFQTDTTRISTFVMANEGSNRRPWIEGRAATTRSRTTAARRQTDRSRRSTSST